LTVVAVEPPWEIDPRQAGMKPGAPDHVGHVEHAAVRQQRLPVADAGDARRTLDAGRGEVRGLDADQRSALRDCSRARATPERGIDREDSVKDQSEENRRDHACDWTLDAERYVAGMPSRQPHTV